MINFKKISGFALIEILVASFVVGVGFLALTSLQGKMTEGSRENKTRAEALALANEKMEELRSTIDKSGYDNLASSSDQFSGKTESFKRGWLIEPQTGNAEFKKVTVVVCWPSNSCSTTTPAFDTSVKLQSFIALDSLTESMLMARGDSPVLGGSPSTNAESSDEITENIHLTDRTATVGSIISYDKNGDGATEEYLVTSSDASGVGAIRAILCSSVTSPSLDSFENNLMTRRINDEAIEMYEVEMIGASKYCIPRLRFNGGVIVPIRGIVHSRATEGTGNKKTLRSFELFSFNASETGAYCVFQPAYNAISAPYTCYVGGNCAGVIDPNAIDTIVTKCPSGSYSADKVGPGGWRGKIGLRGVAGGSTFFNVCFKEELSGTPLTLDTAREYYSRRNGINEGINKPYSNHNFLIINGVSTSAGVSNSCKSEFASIMGNVSLAPKVITRTINSGSNIFDSSIGFLSENISFLGESGEEISYESTNLKVNLDLGSGVENITSFSVNPDFDIAGNTDRVSFVISPACSEKNGDQERKKYQITASNSEGNVIGSTNGTGELTIDTTASTINVKITKSESNCQ